MSLKLVLAAKPFLAVLKKIQDVTNHTGFNLTWRENVTARVMFPNNIGLIKLRISTNHHSVLVGNGCCGVPLKSLITLVSAAKDNAVTIEYSGEEIGVSWPGEDFEIPSLDIEVGDEYDIQYPENIVAATLDAKELNGKLDTILKLTNDDSQTVLVQLGEGFLTLKNQGHYGKFNIQVEAEELVTSSEGTAQGEFSAKRLHQFTSGFKEPVEVTLVSKMPIAFTYHLDLGQLDMYLAPKETDSTSVSDNNAMT